MSSLFHFKEKVHRKNLSKAEAVPLLFLRLLSYVLEHLGLPTELYHERCCVYEATFTIKKWHFMDEGPPLPAFPALEEDL